MTLPPLKTQLQTHHIRADKRFGQHFLLDQNLTDKITRLAGDLSGVNVVEVGPGPGGLTRSLLQSDAASVTVIEKDARMLPLLEELQAVVTKPFVIRQEDALALDLTQEIAAPRAIIANLPYNVGTAMLIHWLKAIAAEPQAFHSLTLMFQKEVAQRIAAKQGEKHYGRLAILSQWLCEVQPLFDLPPHAFTPPPKVDSSVIRLLPRAQPAPCQLAALERLTAAAFGQRRKMLRSSLKGVVPDASAWLESHDINPTARAEEVPIEGFLRLSRSLLEGEGNGA